MWMKPPKNHVLYFYSHVCLLMEKMADANPQEFCRLCLCCKLVEIESLQKIDLTKKVGKYLLIKMEQNSMEICVNCYNSLEDFHKFYEGVHSAQKNFHSFKETETDHFSRKLTVSAQDRSLVVDDEETGESHCDDEVPEDTAVNREVDRMPQANLEGNLGEESVEETELTIQKSVMVNNKLITERLVKKAKLAKQKELAKEIEKKMVEFYNIQCEKCQDIRFNSFKMLSRHYSTVHNTQGYIKCCKRNIRVKDKSYLRSHMLKHLQPESCRCTVCGKQLSSTITLKNHMILHKPTEERPFQCSECDKRFCCKSDLKNHEKAIHIPESEKEDCICDVCGKVFKKAANLKYHVATIHLQQRKYVCELCAKSFTTQSGLRTHRNAAHDTRGPIQCQKCNKWLKNEDTFHKHLQLHRNNSYPCSQCSKVCNSSTSLRSHMVKHSEERPHLCSICQKSFKTKAHLKNHSVLHFGGSNFKCPFCTKTFANMSNYYTHRKRMHHNRDAAKQGNKFRSEKSDVSELSSNVDEESSGNDIGCEYRIVKGDNGVIAFGGNEVSVVRQNIIVLPMNIKYT